MYDYTAGQGESLTYALLTAAAALLFGLIMLVICACRGKVARLNRAGRHRVFPGTVIFYKNASDSDDLISYRQ